MAKQPSLPKSELELVRIVWDLGSAAVREVADALPSDRGLDFFTVQTYLRRLESKGFLSKKKVGRSNVYTAKRQPDKVVGDVLDDMIERLFDGEAMPLLQHLIHDRGLSESEVDQLQATLDQLKGNAKKKRRP